MPNRFKPKSVAHYGQEPLPTGYHEGSVSDVTIPSVGLEDIDTAIFNLFDKELPLAVGGSDSSDLKKVPVVFAGGEKWAMLKRNRPLRDRTNSLILPIITIGRTGFSQMSSEDLAGRGINQKTGEIVVKRKLSKLDRGYQNLINKIFLKHQDNLAVDALNADPGQLTTLNPVGELQTDNVIESGGFLAADRRNNVVETLVIPSPQFVTAKYDVIIWTQYTHHMNQIMETLISSFLPQMQGWRLDTPKGYWFLAKVEDEDYNTETNFDDMSQGERIIKQKFSVKVHAYIFASSSPGVPISVKRYVSNPAISFEIGIAPSSDPINKNSDISNEIVSDPFLGSDDPTLPLSVERPNRRRDMRHSGGTRLFSNNLNEDDPVLQSQLRGTQVGQYSRFVTRGSDGKLQSKYVRIVNTNSHTGETSYAPGADLGGLTIAAIEE